jgi:hypothetical protein
MLADWARADGDHPKTALRCSWLTFLPVPARQVGSRTILMGTAWPGATETFALAVRVSGPLSEPTWSANSAG